MVQPPLQLFDEAHANEILESPIQTQFQRSPVGTWAQPQQSCAVPECEEPQCGPGDFGDGAAVAPARSLAHVPAAAVAGVGQASRSSAAAEAAAVAEKKKIDDEKMARMMGAQGEVRLRKLPPQKYGKTCASVIRRMDAGE